jgi:hypothetical protein
MFSFGPDTLRLDDPGCASSLGQPVTNPRAVLRTAVRFNTTAFAVLGMPSSPVTAKLVVPPGGIGAPALRLSRMRAGAIGTNRPSSVSSAVSSVKYPDTSAKRCAPASENSLMVPVADTGTITAFGRLSPTKDRLRFDVVG